MIQQTSINAFEGIRKELGNRQEIVLETLRNLEVANNTIIAKKLGLPINQITPRVLELREKGLIIKDSMRICPVTKRITWFWRLA